MLASPIAPHPAPAGYIPASTYNPSKVRFSRGGVVGSEVVHLVAERERQSGGRPPVTSTLCGRAGVSAAVAWSADSWPEFVRLIRYQGGACTRCASRSAAT